MKLAKNYKKSYEKIDHKKRYGSLEAAQLIKDITTTKFDASVDIAIKLDIDSTQVDQQLRSTVVLPFGNGKKVRILAICEGSDIENSKKAGATYAMGTEVFAKIKEGWLDFDLIITSAKFMIELGKLGKVLGPKGLMPNPKAGTVTTNIVKTVEEFAKGKQEYRSDKDGNVHLVIGKVSFDAKEIAANIDAIINLIKIKKPASVKGKYFQNISISSTMSPSIAIELPVLD